MGLSIIMDYLLAPFRILYKGWYFFFVGVALLLSYPAFYYFLHNPKRFPTAFVMMRCFAMAWQSFSLAPVKVYGREHMIKNGSYIICANHTSYMDIPVTYWVFRDYFIFVAKREVESWPLFRIFFTSGMNITVDRDSITGSLEAMKRMLKEIDAGRPLAIYPEGTISRSAPLMGEFKQGAFSIAIRKQIPILPVTFVNNWQRLQRNGKWTAMAAPGLSEVVIHPPVRTEGLGKNDAEDLSRRIKEIINKPLKEKYGCEIS